MASIKKIAACLILAICIGQNLPAQVRLSVLEQKFHHPPADAKSWVFWYWMHGAVSKEGITADLQAMKDIGLRGAYLMPIKDTAGLIYQSAIRQLSPQWWEMLRYTMKEAKRLDLQLAMHVSDGFALAGGPWIKPESSMQKIVWTSTGIHGPVKDFLLQQPETNESFYQDIAVYAYPNQKGMHASTRTIHPVITTSNGVAADFLINHNSKQVFKADSAAWIQYHFEQPFTCRSILIKTNGNNYQSHRLIIESSDDGIHFKRVRRLESPRHGWQDTDADVTHSIPSTTAHYFRFVFDKTGTEPGSEDLDAAKWKPVLKVSGIELSATPFIHQYESKNGEIWRVSNPSTPLDLPDSLCTPLDQIIDITRYYKDGKLSWNAPAGDWTILRMGHTSTGHRNETAGGGKGLECDKFNEAAIRQQFDGWFGKTFQMLGDDAKAVLKVFHIDSWECGSQNWSSNFASEFKKRRGYDLMPWMPVFAGVPINSAAASEQVLFDIRSTIAELVNDVFYQTMAVLSKEKDCLFTAESIAPTMMSDGMLHYSKVDIPMGEFWLRSPTHDKPNDMLDAISGGHVYGKNIIQSESFTELRMAWDEHPGMLKIIGDRNFALGVNRFVFHVFTQNPWMNKKPGMTLDGIGLYFQRDQTWFKQGKAWLQYIERCQAILQSGKPVTDIAVFTGEELPRRALLPNRLVETIPGIFGMERVLSEQKRLQNIGQPQRTIPEGVSHSANMADPEQWVNPLNGYAYDSFNPDALLRLASVKDGRIVLPGGASYAMLIIPSHHSMMPDNRMSVPVAKKIKALLEKGATVLMDIQAIRNDSARDLLQQFYVEKSRSAIGNIKLWQTPYQLPDFRSAGLERDIEFSEDPSSFGYQHRVDQGTHIYFISNQKETARQVEVSLRVRGKIPELWNPVDGSIHAPNAWKELNDRTHIALHLEAGESVFVVLKNKASAAILPPHPIAHSHTSQPLQSSWTLHFSRSFGGPVSPLIFDSLYDWTLHANDSIKYYSGTAMYSQKIRFDHPTVSGNIWLNIGEVHDIASVRINGKDCGTLWTAPFRVDISKAIRTGENLIEIEVTNTWANRLIGDQKLPEKDRVSFAIAPMRLDKKPLLKAGLIGPVSIEW